MTIWQTINAVIPAFLSKQKQPCFLFLFVVLHSIAFSQTAANFTINKTSGCVPLSSVNFTENSTGGTVTRRDWNLGNGTIIPNGNQTVGTNYLTAQTFYITLTVTFANGDVKTKTDSVIVHPKPVVAFRADDTAGCIPHRVNFTDLSSTSTGTIQKWTWDFGSGGDSTTQNPAFVYNTSGNYNVSLIVKNSWGCESDAASRFQYIRVYSKPAASFTPSTTVGCEDTLTVRFNNNTAGGSPANRYKWYFGDGDSSAQANPTHFYSAAGTYTVTLVASVGLQCSSTTTRTIYVGRAAPFFVTAPDTVCNNTSIQFLGGATPSPSSLKWIFSDKNAVRNSTPVNYSFASPGDYDVSLIAYTAQGCSDTVTKRIHIKAGAGLKPFFIAAPDTVCVNSPVQFEGSATPAPASVSWVFSDNGAVRPNSPASHTFASPNDYTVSLIAYNTEGCADTITKPIHVKTGLAASFTVAKGDGCAVPFTASFRNTSVQGKDLAFTWNFGDGSSAVVSYQAFAVNHTYTRFGNFTVTVTARDTLVGCTGAPASFSYIRIQQPRADFTYIPPDGCLPLPVKFKATASNLILPILSYVWNYGDGSANDTLKGSETTHTYREAGTFYPTVTIITEGCSFTSNPKSVNVINICDDDGSGGGGGGSGGGGFLIGKSCSNKYSVTFTDTVRNTVVKSWDFGEGSPLYTTPPLNPVTHDYSPPVKAYIVTVVRLDTITKLTDTGRKRIIIIDEKPGFTPDRTLICNKTSVAFSTVGIDSSKIKTYTWDFGDGTRRVTINNAAYFNTYGLYLNGNTSHVYDKTGTFFPKLIIEDKLGCLDSVVLAREITVRGPEANFTATVLSSCLVPVKVLFQDSSKQAGNIPLRHWRWSLGDGSPVYNTDRDTVFSHLYNPATYTVTLTVTDSTGCVGTTTRPVVVPVNTTGPQAGFAAIPLVSCSSPLSVTFKDTSVQNAAIPITEWQWSFGDGTPAFTTKADSAFTHVYTNNNSATFFTVTLRIRDSFGCVSTITKPNYIKMYRPRSNFNSNDTLKCGSFNVFLQNTSSAYRATYQWDFGDGTTSRDFNASHRYAGEGEYNIKLVVKDENGCEDSITRISYIKLVRPVADFKVGDTLKCAPTAITFTSNAQYTTSYVWDFGDGGTGSTDKNPAPKIYPLPGIYKVTLKVKGLNDCVDSTFKLIRVRGPIGALNATLGNGCAPYSISMRVAGSFISTYAWDYNDGTPVNPSFSDSVVYHTYKHPGRYTPNVVLTSPEGCPFTLRVPDTVTVDAAKADFTVDRHTFCDSGLVTFSNRSSAEPFSSLTYAWDFGDGTTDTAPNPAPHLYKNPGRYTVKLFIHSRYGCIDSLVKRDAVTINPSPYVTISGDSTVCLTPKTTLAYLGNVSSKDSVSVYKWAIDADSTGNKAALDVNYRVPGNHRVTLNVSTINGCSYTTSKDIVIDSIRTNYATSLAKFCGTGSVAFTNLTQSFSPVTAYLWNFGDGEVSSSPNVLHPYTNPGNYSVKLLGTTQNGCRDSIVYTDTIQVFQLPRAAITGDSIRCAPGWYNAAAAIQSADSISSYRWYVDAAQQSSTKELSYNFIAGKHSVALQVSTINGCIDSTFKEVIIDSVRSDFSILNPQLCGDSGTVRFDNKSASHFGNNRFLWVFGDGETSAEPTPTHFYNRAGNYVVTLTATTVNGCTDTFAAKDTVKIYKTTIATITGENETCAESRLAYQANVVTEDIVSHYSWKLNSNNISASDTALFHFTEAGTYTLQLTVNTRYSCTATDTKKIIIHPLPVPAAGPDTVVCRGSRIRLRSSDGTTYQWNPSPTLQNIGSATPVATPVTTTSYYVTVTSGAGCVQKDTVTITVDQPVNLVVGDNKILCFGQEVQLSASGNAASYVWSPGADLKDSTASNPIASPTATTTYRVVAYSGSTCKNDTGYVMVAVGNIPLVNAGADTTVAAGTPVQLRATVAGSDVSRYLWTPATGLSCTTCPDPGFTADKNITYKVTVYTTYGCTASDEVTIHVFCNKGKVFIPDAFTPNKDGLNDRFYIRGYGLSKIKSLLIFNRWGQKVFERQNFPVNDPHHGWDGTVNGVVAGSETFVYLVTVVCDDGTEFPVKGVVTLIR